MQSFRRLVCCAAIGHTDARIVRPELAAEDRIAHLPLQHKSYKLIYIDLYRRALRGNKKTRPKSVGPAGRTRLGQRSFSDCRTSGRCGSSITTFFPARSAAV